MAVHDLYFYLSSLGSVLSTLPLLDPKWWSTWSSALLTPTIAGVAALIAHRQAKTARNKLKFDLFERRFAVYDATVLLINKAIYVRNPQWTEEEFLHRALRCLKKKVMTNLRLVNQTKETDC